MTVPAPGVLGNDSDVDAGTTLTAVQVTGPAHATSFTLNANGSFNYTATSGYVGTDSFTYRANDGSLNSNTATVTITVASGNTAPTCATPQSGSTNEDTTLNSSVVCTDAQANTLSYSVVTPPTHGTLTLNADGSFSYTPAANYNGPDSFTLRANDGTLDSNTATVNITVTAVNDAPVAVNDSYTTAEDTTLTVAAPGVLGNDSDIDSPTLTAVLVTGPSHGSADPQRQWLASATPRPPTTTALTRSPTRPTTASLDSNVATVSLTITAVNDAPVAVNDSYGTNEDTTLTVGAPGVLANDSDVDGDSLSSIVVTGPSHGSLTFNANGSFSYTPAANYYGLDSFTYKANDGSLDSNVATVSITVTAVNDAPVAVADAYTTAEDTTLTVAAPGVLGNDSDIDSRR